MIFVLDKLDEIYQVLVFKNLEEVIRSTEWQDIFEGNSIITDQLGQTYKWDDSKIEEIGTIHDYSLIQTKEKYTMIHELLRTYANSEDKFEFELKQNE